MVATIRVNGASARLLGLTAPAAHLKECLRFFHPGARFNKAFQQGRWDGYVCLADGNSFPSGLLSRVRSHLRLSGHRVRVIAPGCSPVEAPNLGRKFLQGIKLWDHQLDAIHVLLANARGTIKSSTGSGKTAVVAAAARVFWEERGWRSLVIVPKRGLARQTQAALRRFYGEDIEVGIAGDGLREEGAITVATAATLIHFEPRTVFKTKGQRKQPVRYEGDEDLIDLLASTDVLFIDECHRTSSDTWQRIAEACNARRRYGLSGTPLVNSEFRDVKLEAATGPMLHEIEARDLIEKRIVSLPKIVMLASQASSSEPLQRVAVRNRFGKIRMSDPAYRDAYRAAIIESDEHNRAVVLSARWLLRYGRRVLILCRLLDHFVRLSEMLAEHGIEVACLSGRTPTDEREEAKQQFADGRIKCILATTIFDEGEDVPGIDAIVLAEGVQAVTSALQRIGRGMRRRRASDVWVVDIVPLGSSALVEHAARRAETYEREGYEVVVQEEWPTKDPRKLGRTLLPFHNWPHS